MKIPSVTATSLLNTGMQKYSTVSIIIGVALVVLVLIVGYSLWQQNVQRKVGSQQETKPDHDQGKMEVTELKADHPQADSPKTDPTGDAPAVNDTKPANSDPAEKPHEHSEHTPE